MLSIMRTKTLAFFATGIAGSMLLGLIAFAQQSDNTPDVPVKVQTHYQERWQRPGDVLIEETLSAEQYRVTQQDGTERPFRNAYWDNKERGIYVDVVSGEPLFSSRDKFKSGTGWPSFSQPLVQELIMEKEDWAWGMHRIEVRSRLADSHLGHVFDDGPDPTGLRYCINSAALRFIPREKMVEEGYGDFVSFVD